MNPSMTGKDILIVEHRPKPENLVMTMVKIVGTGYAGMNHVLVVQAQDDDDISIITREYKGSRWEAYEVLEGF